MTKKISIIMATLNSEKYVAQAITSVLDQDIEELEIIIVDGGSTDGTLEIVNRIESNKIKIVMGKDSGIAEAWNKGMKIASGELIGMLNSDDYYDNGVLTKVIKQIGGTEVPIIGYGDVTMIEPSGKVIREVIGRNRTKIALLNGFGFMHTSVIINRKAYDRVGPFNQKIRIAIDTDWLLRCVSHNIIFKKISNHVYMRQGGISEINKYAGMGEYADALMRNGYNQKYMILFFLFRLLGHVYKLVKLK